MNLPAPREAAAANFRRLLLAAACVGGVLAAMAQALNVPSGWGVEHLLGWMDPNAVQALQSLWVTALGERAAQWLPRAYLVLDNALYMPVYGLMLASALAWSRGALAERGGLGAAWRIGGGALGTAALAALLLLDGLENSAGLLRLQSPTLLALAWLAQAAVLVWLWRGSPELWPPLLALRPARGVLLGALLLALALAAAVAGGALRAADCQGPQAAWWWAAGCTAHAWKFLLLGLAAAVPVLTLLWCTFGQSGPAGQQHWRYGLLSLPWRSRYVLAVLGLLVALLLVMNQGRDVLYAMAAHPWDSPAHVLQALVMLGLSALSVWTLCHACWLWSRAAVQVCAGDGPRQRASPQLQALARDWARLLGLAPALVVALACLRAVGDAAGAGGAGTGWTVFVLLAFVAGVLVGAVAFVWQRVKRGASPDSYHDARDLGRLLQDLRDAPHLRLLFRISPLWQGAFALALALACRALALATAGDDWPTLSLPIMLFSLGFWLALAGWVSLYEQARAVPLLLLALAWVGALGVAGAAENHGVSASPGLAAWALWAWALVLAAVVGAVFTRLVWRALNRPLPLRAVLARLALLMGLLCLGLAWGPDRQAEAARAEAARSSAPAPPVLALDTALRDWLQVRALAAGAGQPFPLRLVAAEGGGIRAAHWAASVMLRAQGVESNYMDHVFAASGVSGGSVGLTVWRACQRDAKGQPQATDAVQTCVQRAGSADLLAPLVGPWLLEDGLARLLPQWLCRQPGCGFLSRSLGFERAMLQVTPQLGQGLRASREAYGGPYLLLNSTWVETGERTIASELDIAPERFPNARDQLAWLGVADLPLATAAHNSARFPFTNALGAVRRPQADCQAHPAKVHGAVAPAASAAAPRLHTCGHLADGGYFDNSGVQALVDVLAALRRQRDACGTDRGCPAWRAQPQLLVLRNGVKPGQGERDSCQRPVQPNAAQVRLRAPAAGAQALADPRCAGRFGLYADALGPLITAVNAIGTGANGRLAVARAGAAAALDVHTLALVDDGPLFALGWHLSNQAAAQMGQRARDLPECRFAPRQPRQANDPTVCPPKDGPSPWR